MVLEPDQYNIDGDRITIHKQTLEELKCAYSSKAGEWSSISLNLAMFIAGKAELLTDIIKLFDQDESE